METKLIEVRDKGTFLVVLATRLDPTNYADCWLLSRAGYGEHPTTQSSYVVTTNNIYGGRHMKATSDYAEWGDRTYGTIHRHLFYNWSEVASGDVLDVEYLLGETLVPKRSERFVDDEPQYVETVEEEAERNVEPTPLAVAVDKAALEGYRATHAAALPDDGAPDLEAEETAAIEEEEARPLPEDPGDGDRIVIGAFEGVARGGTRHHPLPEDPGDGDRVENPAGEYLCDDHGEPLCDDRGI